MVALGSSHQSANLCEDLKGVRSSALNLQSSHQDRFFLELEEIIRLGTPEQVLLEFKNLFFQPLASSSLKTFSLLQNWVKDNKKQYFLDFLKRSCYILFNSLATNGRLELVGELLKLFFDYSLPHTSFSPLQKRMKTWVRAFAESQDYQDLITLIQEYSCYQLAPQKTSHWSDRYMMYQWVAQSVELGNPPEQRELASQVAQQMKDRFKYDLAMYTARAQSAGYDRQMHPNPTLFGDDALRLIKLAIARHGDCGYEQLSWRLLEQTKTATYETFKEQFQKYLLKSGKSQEEIPFWQNHFVEKLNLLCRSKQNEPMNSALLLVTCNRALEWLTTENKQEPSAIFKMLVSQGSPFTLAILLLKIVLLSPNSRVHLECCLADLLRYYKQLPGVECTFAIQFFEALKILLAIYSGDVEYSLVRIKQESSIGNHSVLDINQYRVFLAFKSARPPRL